MRPFQLKEALAARASGRGLSTLHPLIPQGGMLPGRRDCRPEGEALFIDLTLPPEEQRRGIAHR